jgi:hypothetical protein
MSVIRLFLGRVSWKCYHHSDFHLTLPQSFLVIGWDYLLQARLRTTRCWVLDFLSSFAIERMISNRRANIAFDQLQISISIVLVFSTEDHSTQYGMTSTAQLSSLARRAQLPLPLIRAVRGLSPRAYASSWCSLYACRLTHLRQKWALISGLWLERIYHKSIRLDCVVIGDCDCEKSHWPGDGQIKI